MNDKFHSWVITFQIANMIKAGWSANNYLNHEWLANALNDLWVNSGKGRTSAVAVCTSSTGLYHAHIAAYSEGATTFKAVKKIFYDAHVEPQYGGKKELSAYLKKDGKYAEKGETVHYILNEENVADVQGKRSDLDEIQKMLDAGMTPEDVFSMGLYTLKYRAMIREYFFLKQKQATPLKREIKVIWHVGETGSGKSYSYITLAEQRGEKKIYFMTDYLNGGLDKYEGEEILFMDEFKGEISYGLLLIILGKYRAQIHCRFTNIVALWTEVHITSIYPPEEVYHLMVAPSQQPRDSLQQLMGRITMLQFHYVENGQYKAYAMPSSEYKNYDDLKQRALCNNSGFIPLNAGTKAPFDKDK